MFFFGSQNQISAKISTLKVPSPSGHVWLLKDDYGKHAYSRINTWNDGVRISACENTCRCQILELECTGLSKCSGSCNNENKVNDIESEIDGESDDNGEKSEA